MGQIALLKDLQYPFGKKVQRMPVVLTELDRLVVARLPRFQVGFVKLLLIGRFALSLEAAEVKFNGTMDGRAKDQAGGDHCFGKLPNISEEITQRTLLIQPDRRVAQVIASHRQQGGLACT